MSQPGLANQPSAPNTKHRFNVYTMMLIMSFIALIIGSVLLARELNQYGKYPWWNTSEVTAGAGS